MLHRFSPNLSNYTVVLYDIIKPCTEFHESLLCPISYLFSKARSIWADHMLACRRVCVIKSFFARRRGYKIKFDVINGVRAGQHEFKDVEVEKVTPKTVTNRWLAWEVIKYALRSWTPRGTVKCRKWCYYQQLHP